MPLARNAGTLLRVDGKLATSCCCDPPVCPCDSAYPYLRYQYTEATGNLGPFCSFTYIRGEQTFTIPSDIPVPCYVSLQGDVNDDLLVNGAAVDPGKYPFGGNPCNGSHNLCHVFLSENRSFTLATKDNYGSGMSADIEIRFCVAAIQGNPLP
jgi:hypothetical protein